MIFKPKRLLSNINNFTLLSTRFILIVLLLVSVTGVSAQNPDLPALTPKRIAQTTLPSIVILIVNNGDNLPITMGSGFFVSEDTIITNYHVIKDAKMAAFRIYGSNEVYSIIGTLGIDSNNDLALLKVKGVKGKPLRLNSKYQLSIGDDIFTVSSPKGLEGTFSQGLISGLRKTSEKEIIQISAPISHGSSGGAILNNQAEVIAVAVGGINEGQSLNFAVPIKYAQVLMTNKTVLTDLPGKSNNLNGNNPTSDGRGSGQSIGNGQSINSSRQALNSPIENPEISIKAPSTVLETLKSRISPPDLKPNLFKVSDLEDKDYYLRGDVYSILITGYEAVTNFDKFKKGKKIYEGMFLYNRDGNMTSRKENDYEDNTHSEAIQTYNSATRTITYKKYSDGNFEEKVVMTFNSKGEKTVRSFYDATENLKSKETTEYTGQFSKSKYCSAENDCETMYIGLDKNEVETWISYKNKNLDFIGTFERNNLAIKKTKYDFCHGGGFDENDEELPCNYNGKLAKIEINVYLYNSQTDQLIGETIETRDLDNPENSIEKESYKYEYKYDSKGNWIEQVKKKEVTKFGETYFEPILITERQIKYLSDSDAKSSNKRIIARRKND